MSIRIQGLQAVTFGPQALAEGATKATFFFTIKFNSRNFVQPQWLSYVAYRHRDPLWVVQPAGDGSAPANTYISLGGSFAYIPEPTPGRVMRFVCSYDADDVGQTRKFYVDGVFMQSSGGVASMAQTVVPDAFQFGGTHADSAPLSSGDGVDFEVERVGVVVGQVPTAEQVMALHMGEATHQAVYGANLKAFLALTGTPGAAVAATDPGIVDSLGGLVDPVFTGGAPAWSAAISQAPPVVYPVTCAFEVGRSSKTLAVLCHKASDGSQSLGALDRTNYMLTPGMTAGLTYTVDGGPPVALPAPAVGTGPIRAWDYGVWPLADAIPRGAVVAVSAAKNWISTALGSAGASVAVPAINRAGDPYLLPTPTGHTLRIAKNAATAEYYGQIAAYTDFMKQSGSWGGSPGRVEDIDGNLLSMSGYAQKAISSSPGVSNLGNASGYGQCLEGEYKLQWIGLPAGATIKLSHGEAAAPLVAGTEAIAGTAGSRRYSFLKAPGKYGVDIYYTVVFSGNPTDIAGLRASIWYYGPDGTTPEDQTKTFGPNYRRVMGDCFRARNMDPMRTNHSNASTYGTGLSTDFAGPNSVSAGSERADHNFAITGISQSQDLAGFFLGGPVVKFTTATPHRLKHGHGATLNYSESPRFNIDMLNTAGAPVTLDLTAYANACYVIDPYNYAMSLGSNLEGYTLAPQTPAGANGTLVVKDGFRVRDCVDLAIECGHQQAAFNIPHLMDDAGVDAMADEAIAMTPPGMKHWVELSNEAFWNTGFRQTHGFHIQGSLLGYSGAEARAYGYAERAGQVHSRWTARLAAHGRPASDLVRYVGLWLTEPAATRAIVDYMADPARAYPIDEAGPSVYLSGGPANNGAIDLDPVWSSLSPAQAEDVSWLTLTRSPTYTTLTREHDVILRSKYPDCKMVPYEGSVESLIAWGSHAGEYSRAWMFHPNRAAFEMTLLAQTEAQGADMFTFFTAAQPAGPTATPIRADRPGNANNGCWAAVMSSMQVEGRGDGTLGSPDNRTRDPYDYPNLVSPALWAYNTWHRWVNGVSTGPVDGGGGIIPTLPRRPAFRWGRLSRGSI